MNHYDMLIYRSLHQDLSVRDLNVSWRQGTSASAHIRWSGRTEPTFSTSDTLPAGVTMSTAGLVSYDGTACTPDTYSWTVTATDGTSTVTATVTLVMAYAKLVIGAGQSFKFKLGTASSQQIQYTADGTPAFAVSSGSLPAGVTMTQGGLLEYDGTGSTETTASVEVTATMQYAQTATATVGVALKTSVIPEDYAFYASLSSKAATSESGSSMSYSGGISEATQDGVPCLDFSRASSTDRITTNFKVNPDSSVKTFTACWWMWLRNNAYDSGMLGRNNQGFRITVLQSGKAETTLNSVTQGRIVSSSAPSTGAWHFIVYTGDGSTTTLYVDGVSQGTASYTSFNENYDMIIGNGWGQNSFNGYMAAVRFYRRVLTGDEITALANEDLAGDTSDSSSSGGTDTSDSSSSGGSAPTDYVFRAPLSTSLDDVSASSRIATESGGSATVGEVKDGVTCTYIPQAVRVKYPIGDVSVGSADRTFSVWFWTTSSVSWGSLMTVGANSSKAMFCIGTRTSSSLPVFSANGADLEPSSPSLKDGAWHHICASLSGTLVSLYVDGTLLGTKTITGLNTSSTDICIGGRPNVTSDIAQNAWYADARIYNRALSDADVAALYAKGINVE